MFLIQIDRVDIDYFRIIPIGRNSPRIDLKEETKLKADHIIAEEYLSKTTKQVDPHFISEIFFLNSYAHSIGMGPIMQTHSRLEGDLQEMQRQVDRFNAVQDWRNSPQAALFSAALARTKAQIEETASLEAAMDAVVYDRVNQEKSLDFLGFVANWLLRLVDSKHLHPKIMIKLPLSDQVPVSWRALPQFLFEIITDHLLHLMRSISSEYYL
jgi:ubiquitin conjugation factor E4 B